jgi:hypothetical protein
MEDLKREDHFIKLKALLEKDSIPLEDETIYLFFDRGWSVDESIKYIRIVDHIAKRTCTENLSPTPNQ